MKNKFKTGDFVIHKKTNKVYQIKKVPVKNKVLEYCNEPFYVYQTLNSYMKWFRCKSEMEDGRFVLKTK